MSGVAASFGSAPNAYGQGEQNTFRASVRASLSQAYKLGTDLEMGSGRMIMTSPNGTRFAATVDNGGSVVLTAL